MKRFDRQTENLRSAYMVGGSILLAWGVLVYVSVSSFWWYA